jgi:hypothetical protein
MLVQQAAPHTADEFDIKRAQRVNHMALLDAENLKFAAPRHPTPQTAGHRCVETITEIGQPLDPAVALCDSDAITVIPRQHKFRLTKREG